MSKTGKILAYRVFFPDRPAVDFDNLFYAQELVNKTREETGQFLYIHPLREGGPDCPLG